MKSNTVNPIDVMRCIIKYDSSIPCTDLIIKYLIK